MANATIPMLPQAISLTGAEQMEAVQAGQSVRVTAAQVSAVANAINGIAAAVPANGANHNYTVSGLMGPTIGFLELTPAGNCNITGIIAGFDGQLIIITNLSANTLTLNALNAGSVAANQFRMNADITAAQNTGYPFKYSVQIGKWVSL